MKNNIILIGMPGVGKSTIGVVLAKSMGYSFLDSDLLIQEREGRLLHEILDQQGQNAFRQIENEVNASISVSSTVIATGGSVIYGVQAMEHLRSIGRIVYLSLPYEELENRLGDLRERGVSMEKGQSLSSLYEERLPLYEKYADIKFSCQNLTIREIVQRLTVLFRKQFPIQ